MCGIAGFIGKFPEELLNAFNYTLKHRGPDGNGTYYDKESGIGFSHCRLAIQDTSDAGKQPMTTYDGRYTIVYNGEIYNSPNLRKEISHEFNFSGTSDTEVLINAYSKYGKDIFKRLNGIYALAIWDSLACTLTIARDPYGVKPLYYTRTERGFVFASEIKALLHVKDMSRGLDEIAIGQYLTYLYTPGERTMFKSVRKLLPGHVMTLTSREGEEVKEFFKYPYRNEEALMAKSKEDAYFIFNQSVKRQMLSDVPVASFLSGGFDSSAIVMCSDVVDTYTISSESSGKDLDGFVEDLPYARIVARHANSELHEISVKSNMLEDLHTLVWNLNEPQADPAALNLMYMCRVARKNGYKVMFSGAGGDDLFTGYRRHSAWMLDRMVLNAPVPIRRIARSLFEHYPISSANSRRIRKYVSTLDAPYQKRLASYYEWLSLKRVSTLGVEVVPPCEIAQPIYDRLAKLPGRITHIDKMLALDVGFFLVDHNLNYTDKMGMAEGVEIRVPFLDHKLVEFAFSLRQNLKVHGSSLKWLIREGFRGTLPDEVIDRSKTGFGVPLRVWMRQGRSEVIKDSLSSETIKKRGIFDLKEIRQLEIDCHKGAEEGYYTLLAAVCIEVWCRVFLRNDISMY